MNYSNNHSDFYNYYNNTNYNFDYKNNLPNNIFYKSIDGKANICFNEYQNF